MSIIVTCSKCKMLVENSGQSRDEHDRKFHGAHRKAPRGRFTKLRQLDFEPKPLPNWSRA